MNQEKITINKESVEKIIHQSYVDSYNEHSMRNLLLKALSTFQDSPQGCKCNEDIKTGETEMLVMCCNVCGKPVDNAVGRFGETQVKFPNNLDIVNATHNYVNKLCTESKGISELEAQNIAHDFNAGANYVINYMKEIKE